VTIILILKINSLARIISPGIDKSYFVNDLSIIFCSKAMASIEQKMQICLNRILKWSNENGFKFSKNKMVCVHFFNKRKFHLDPELYLDG
jgi:hypothetical protein